MFQGKFWVQVWASRLLELGMPAGRLWDAGGALGFGSQPEKGDQYNHDRPYVERA